MRDLSMVAGTCLLCAFGLTTIAAAQDPPTWNRSIEGIAVLPDDAGGHSVSVMVGVEAENLLTIGDLSVDLSILVNGSLVETQTHEITAYPAGMSQNCPPCLTFQPCICCDWSGVCACGGFVAAAPGGTASHVLQPGDLIEVALSPTPTALPEPNTTGDALTAAFTGEPIFWERRVVAATFKPSSSSPDAHDLHVQWEAVLANVPYDLDLSTELVVLINGMEAAMADACAGDPYLIAPDGVCSPGLCGLLKHCATGSCAGSNTVLRCRFVESAWGTSTCACLSEVPMNLIVPGLMLKPGDEVSVMLVSKTSAGLPNLPGSEPYHTLVVDFACPADLNGDGVVSGMDLGSLLSQWGPCQQCDTCAQCPADLNNDCTVSGADLGILLSNWTG